MPTIRTHYYQQFDADYSLDVPAEGYGGWAVADLPLSLEHTALVVMHAWDCGRYEDYPGWHRKVEYIPRAAEIDRTVFPPLLAATRRTAMPVFHVVGGGDYYKQEAGYLEACDWAGATPPPPPSVASDDVAEQLWRFKAELQEHNAEDVKRGFANIDFAPHSRPVDGESVAENAQQLFAVCQQHQINHLVYIGFAINWCLLLSPGGMADMSKHGVMCSTIREAVTAVENKTSARDELAKEIGLWRVACAFGYVYDLPDFTAMLEAAAG